MKKTMFCYEVLPAAGLAYDRETGEDASAYLKIEIPLGRTLTDEEYEIVHTKEALDLLVGQIKMNKEHLKPISIEEFLENNEED